MIVDLHAHYPMHVVPEAKGSLWQLLRTPLGRARLRDRTRALLVGFASQFINYRLPDPPMQPHAATSAESAIWSSKNPLLRAGISVGVRSMSAAGLRASGSERTRSVARATA
jgi:hypothetical protein